VGFAFIIFRGLCVGGPSRESHVGFAFIIFRSLLGSSAFAVKVTWVLCVCVCVCVCILRPSSTTWPEGHAMGLQVRFAAQDGQRGGCQLNYLNMYMNGPPEGGPSRCTALHDIELCI
jgi:hypothetical protein